MTILNQTEILTSGIPYWLKLVTDVVICLFILFLLLTLTYARDCNLWPFYGLVVTSGLATICIITSLAYGIFTDNHTGRYRYECTIDDDASFTDILEDYVVIEQRGDLWILEDK